MECIMSMLWKVEMGGNAAAWIDSPVVSNSN